MSTFVVGINHKTASIAMREKVYFASDRVSLYLQDLLGRGIAEEAVLLSTCNRSELYCQAENIESVRAWFCAQTSLSSDELQAALYVYEGHQAITHIMEVACGLDSMVLGESQILGQMKEAFSESCTVNAISSSFHHLFQHVFTVAKEIRTSTAIGACPVSVASAALHFAKQQVDQFYESNIVLIGAGDTSALLLRYLKQQMQNPIILINRSHERAEKLAQQYNCIVYDFDMLDHALSQADIVFSATGSATPIVSKAIVAEALAKRKVSLRMQPLTLIDIAVPRDIQPEVGELSSVNLFCIDDLKSIIEKNLQGREHAADKAREMIHLKSIDLINELQSRDKVSYTISAYRQQIESICRAELSKAKQQLNQGVDPHIVLDVFAHVFTKKLLHAPSVQLRQAGAEGRFDLLRLAKQLFSLPDTEIERL